jgi:GAF domain-containing protein
LSAACAGIFYWTTLTTDPGRTEMSTATSAGNTTTPDGASAGAPLGSAEADLLPLLTEYLDDVATRSARRLGNIAGVAITLRLDGAPFTVGASNDLARDVDLIQYEIGTGPCLHALRHGVGLYVPDLAGDDRWGEYGPKAAARGAASCVSVPVIVDDVPVAVLKVYAGEIDGLSSQQRVLAQTSAPEVAGGVGLAKHLARQAHQLDDQTQQLQDRVAAMSTRRVIDLAIGVLMGRLKTDPDTAFGLLRKASQSRNVKLRDIAQELLESIPGTGGEMSGRAPFNHRSERPTPTS